MMWGAPARGSRPMVTGPAGYPVRNGKHPPSGPRAPNELGTPLSGRRWLFGPPGGGCSATSAATCECRLRETEPGQLIQPGW